MGVNTVVQLLLMQLQYIALLGNLDVNWPTQWRNFLNFMNIFALDPQDLIGDQEIPVIDFRILFIIVSVVLPVVLNILILLLARPMYIVLWYATLVTGVMLLVVGALGLILPSTTGDSNTGMAQVYLIVGAALAGGMILIALINLILVKCCGKEVDMVDNFEREQASLKRFHRSRTLQHIVVIALCGLIGAILLGYLPFGVAQLQEVRDSQGSLAAGFIVIIGWALLGFAAIVFLYAIPHCFARGRSCMQKLRVFVKNNLLMVLLLLISASYIPTMQYCVNMFMCADYSCPAGTIFNPRAARDPWSYDRSEERYCDPCKWLPKTTDTCGATQIAELCPQRTYSRNWQNPDVSCEDETSGYFFFAAGVVMVVYFVMIPLLFIAATNFLVESVAEKAVYVNMQPEEEPRQRWLLQIAHVRPAAGSLYEPFELDRKHTTVAMIIHRLAIVTMLVVVAPFSQVATVFILIIHAGAGVLLAVFRPFIDPGEQALATALAVCNVLNAAFAVFVWQQGDAGGNAITGIFIFINVVVPILVTAVMKYRQYKRMQQLAEDREKAYAESDAVKSAESEAEQLRHKLSMEGKNLSRPERKAMRARIRQLEEEVDGPLKQVKHANNALTNALNEQTLNLLSRFFMVMGIFFFIALGACVLGTLRSSLSEFRIGTADHYQTTKYALGGYDSWTNFTDSCCCANSTHPAVKYSLSERWACANGNYVERGRVTADGVHSALALRPFCSKVFNYGCDVAVDAAGAVSFFCPPDVERTYVPKTVTDTAYALYW